MILIGIEFKSILGIKVALDVVMNHGINLKNKHN